MKEPYYVYNNEAISSLILMSVVKQLNTIDIVRLFLILPCLLDDRFVNYVARTNNQSSFSTILKEKANLFVNFNQRYLELMPIAINSVMILKQCNLLTIKINCIEIIESGDLNNPLLDVGERLQKIIRIIPQFIEMIAPYNTLQLYKFLKVQL